MNKKEFLKSAASAGTKKNVMISLIITVVLIATMFLSYITVLNTSLEKIPFIKLALSSASDNADEEFEDIMDELEDEVDNVEDQYEDKKDEFSKKEQKLVEKLIKAAKKTAESFSINNIKKFADVTEDIIKEGGLVEDEDYFGSTADDMKEIKEVISIASTAVLICMLFALLFSTLGGLLKAKGLVIAGLIFSIIYTLIFCGFLWLLVIAVVHIALFIFLKKIDDDYKAYMTQAMNQNMPQYPQY